MVCNSEYGWKQDGAAQSQDNEHVDKILLLSQHRGGFRWKINPTWILDSVGFQPTPAGLAHKNSFIETTLP